MVQLWCLCRKCTLQATALPVHLSVLVHPELFDFLYHLHCSQLGVRPIAFKNLIWSLTVSRLVLVHGVNGKRMEKYYLISTTFLSLALNVPPFVLHQFG